MQHAGGRASARMRLHQLAIVALAALLEWALVGGTRSVVGAEPPLAVTFGTQAPLPLGWLPAVGSTVRCASSRVPQHGSARPRATRT